MRKRISIAVALILTVVLCFSLSACSAVQGKSAYDIACENGFIGTEREWLDSLKGSDGRDGSNGQDGRNGSNGQDGSDGQDARDVGIYELYEAYLAEHPDATFAEFLQTFMITGYTDTEYAVAKGIQSVVSVYSTFSRKNPKPGQSSEYMSGGAGIVYRIRDGYAYIITNYHVIYDRDAASNGLANKIEVYSFGHENVEKAIQGDFIGGSITKDIAVIKAQVSDFSSDIKAVQCADSNELALGERVVAIGNPLGESLAVSSGVISVDSEEIEMEALDSASRTNVMRVIRTDTPINSGNSGGGLFDMRGELLGIVNAKTIESGVENMGYAIPVNVAAGIADCVIDNDSQKCVFGIMVTIFSTQTQYDLEKNRVDIIDVITVYSVTAGALAENKLLEGDKLISVRLEDGEAFPITRLFHLSDYLYKVRQNDTIYLEIERDGVEMTVEFTPQAENFISV